MGLRGPQPVPSAIKKLRGNPGKRPLPNEPKRDALTVDDLKAACPEQLSAERKRWWRYYAETFGPSKIITATDLILLEQLCSATAERVDFDRKLEEAGPLYKSPKTGYIVVSPMYGLASSARDREFKLLQQFGGSPTSRPNVQPVGGAKSDNPWAEFG